MSQLFEPVIDSDRFAMHAKQPPQQSSVCPAVCLQYHFFVFVRAIRHLLHFDSLFFLVFLCYLSIHLNFLYLLLLVPYTLHKD